MRSPAWLTPFVKDFGMSPEVRSQSFCSVPCDKFGNPTIRIIQVAENSDLRRTRAHTSRFFTFTDQINAEPALDRNPLPFIHKPDLVRTGFYAVLATYAPFSVNQNNPFRRCINSACRANALARGVFAMVALHGNEFFGKCRKLAAFLFFDPIERVFVIQILLILTGNPAGMASYAFGSVNSDSVSRHIMLP
jgi:hypothetical protein